MSPEERAQMRREILADVGAMLLSTFAAGEYGRCLVELGRRGKDDPLEVAGLDVEEIIGDEVKVESSCNAPEAHGALPVLAKATEALCGLEDVEVEDVGGGTFIRRLDQAFAFLPGLVHTPSTKFDERRDALVAALNEKSELLRARHEGYAEGRFEVDLAPKGASHGVIRFLGDSGTVRALADATMIGTYSIKTRAWTWGGGNPTLPDAVRARAAALIDGILERDMWEVTRPSYAIDEASAWALSALVVELRKADGVFRAPIKGGTAFILLENMRTGEALA